MTTANSRGEQEAVGKVSASSCLAHTTMINNDISAASPGVSEPGPPRRRLPAATRVTQILDAALQVFSDKGFASARLDDIAEAAGLSKGGVYTHFASKEEIFGALLKRLIQPPMPAAPEALADEEPVTVDLLVRRVVEPMYQSLGDPSVLQAVRLLLANGTRVPQAFDQWHQTMLEPHIADVARLLQRGVQQGTLRSSAITREPRLILSPGIHAMLDCVVRGAAAPDAMSAWERLHVAMLRELLTP